MYTGIGTGSQGCPSPPRPNAQIPPKSLSTPIWKVPPTNNDPGGTSRSGGSGEYGIPPSKRGKFEN